MALGMTQPPVASVEPSAAPSAADVVALSDQWEIAAGSFSVEVAFSRDFWNVIPFVHTRDYAGVTSSGWRLRGEMRDAASIAASALECAA